MVWKQLAHPNIVPLLGVTTIPLQFVSGWMSGGNLMEYIETKRGPCADKRKLVSDYPATSGGTLTPHQLSDVAEGLNYLHSHNVFHGSLKVVCYRSKVHRAIVLTPNHW